MIIKDIIGLYNNICAIYHYKRRKNPCISPPTIIWIEPTNKCNLKCIMCPNSLREKKELGFMSWELFTKIIDESSAFIRTATLHLSGESLLHKDIFRMIAYCEDKGIRTRLHTNATLLSEENAHKLLESKLSFLGFSFEGYNKETYEKIRVNAKFESTLNNIIAFLKLRDRMKKKKPYVVLYSVILHQENEDEKNEKEKFYRFLEEEHIDEIIQTSAYNWAGIFEETDLFDHHNYASTFYPCPYTWTALSILWDGTVVPCCLDINGDYRLGNVKEDSLIKLWNNEPMQWLRSRMNEQNYHEIKLCSKCDLLWQTKAFWGLPGTMLEILGYSISNLLGFRTVKLMRSLFRHYIKKKLLRSGCK